MSTTPATPFEPALSGSDKFDPDQRKTDIKQLYEASSKFMQENFLEEFVEAYRAVKVRTNPIMIKVNGKDVEDTNRTNVCMPGLNTIVKRKTARKTANPPTLNYYVPGDDPEHLADRLTARALYEYDSSGEAWEFKRFVNQADIFGFSYCKTYYDTVDVVKQMRYRVASLTDRRKFMQAQGAGEDQIQSAIQQQGDTVDQQELSDFMHQNGPEIRGQMPFTQYEGPVTKCRFIGDIFIEPGCLTLNESSFAIEKYTETDLWLRKMASKTYTDPETRKEGIPLFDRARVQELWDKESRLSQDRVNDLRKELRASIQKPEPMIEQRLLPGKRFDIMEYHGPDKRGQMWIEYIGNDSVYLGRQPYPFDLCGKFVYTEYVPWPDIIGAIGDSSPRVLRFLHSMHNANAGQTIDLVNKVLRRQYLVSSEQDIPTQSIDTPFGQFLVMKNGDMNAIRPFVEPEVPPDAWQTNAFIKTEMRENEPSLGGVDSGTTFNPQADKTATTAILAAKSSDVLMQSEIDALNLALKELGEKKLEIHRQLSDKPIPIPNRPQYVKTEALTQKFGKTALIHIDPYEIQDPSIQVEPVAGSTLAVDDELRANKIEKIYAMAEADPVLWSKPKAGQLVATTLKGVGDTTGLLNDQSQQSPPPPKASLNISLPLDKAANVPADILNPVLQQFGFQPSQDVVKMQELQAPGHVLQAANDIVELHGPAKPPEDAAQKTATTVQRKLNGAL